MFTALPRATPTTAFGVRRSREPVDRLDTRFHPRFRPVRVGDGIGGGSRISTVGLPPPLTASPIEALGTGDLIARTGDLSDLS
jgi:hypothetical protein